MLLYGKLAFFRARLDRTEQIGLAKLDLVGRKQRSVHELAGEPTERRWALCEYRHQKSECLRRMERL